MAEEGVDRLNEFIAALDRMVTLAEFYVGVGGENVYDEAESPLAYHPAVGLGLVFREAFIEAERACGELAGISLPLSMWDAVHAGVSMYHVAAGLAKGRWRFTEGAWLQREGRPAYYGTIYPAEFPWRHAVAPEELETFKGALAVLRLPRRATEGGASTAIPDPPADVPRGSMGDVLSRLGFSTKNKNKFIEFCRPNPDVLIRKAHSGKKRDRWDLWVLNREKYPKPD